ncbi:MAG: 3-dehydroquinate synthase [Bacteroidota bacterium]
MYPDYIKFPDDICLHLNRLFKTEAYTKIGVLVDEHTKAHCLPHIAPALPSDFILFEIKSGEQNKNLITCEKIWSEMTSSGFDRSSLLINLGGGVIGDMGGFCAATFKRGINFINIPTTLLAQVDASIGGKLGIDFGHYKNHIGLFQDPYQVIIYPEFLDTLPRTELRSGFAEVIKHGLIADQNYWASISGLSFDAQPWEEHIKHSIGVKGKVVENDPTEKGLRKILNFGHTIGHAVEGYYLNDDNQKLLHGDAVAIGMICEAYLSQERCGLSQEAFGKISSFILDIYEHLDIKQDQINDIVKLLGQDKKNKGNKILCSLLETEGKAVFDVVISVEDAKKALSYYSHLSVKNL